MWFGTYDGLNRYDGYEFRVFRNKLLDSLSLPHNYIYAISEDRHNRLWICTGQGAVTYNRLKAAFMPVYYHHMATGKREKMTTNATVLMADKKNNLFIGTNGRGLLLLADGSETAAQIPYGSGASRQTEYNVTAILIDRQNRVWLFINEVGLCRYDERNRRIVLVNDSLKTATSLQADDKNIWIGTSAGLHLFDMASRAIVRTYTEAGGQLSSNVITSLWLDKQRKLWIGTEGGGITVLTIDSGGFEYLQPKAGAKSLSSETVSAVYEDKEDRKWVGTTKGGIDIIDPWQTKFQTIAHQPFSLNGLVNNFVSCFYEAPDRSLFIGTDGGGFSIWNRQQNGFKNFYHQSGKAGSLSYNLVSSITQDHTGSYWLATYGGGINKFDRASGSFRQYHCINPLTHTENKNVWLLVEDRQQTLWATTFSQGQLYRYNPLADQFELFAPAVYDLISFREDADGEIWGGNFQQIIQIDRRSGRALFYPIGKPVRAIFESRKKQFWLGTEGGGLILFNRRTGQIQKRFSDANGLCNNAVLNILEDDQGNLWLSTFNGLSKFNPETETFQNFYQSDGLQSNQFAYSAALRLRSGEMVFGGIKGFTIFHPDSLQFQATTPPVQLTGLRINNLSVTDSSNQAFVEKTVGDKITALTMPYNQAVISFDYAALEYSLPDKISYGSFLEGWDKSWNYSTKQRSAHYTHLKEGSYTLYLKWTNAAGKWSSEEAVMKIRVLPPWYRSWWAYLIYCGIVAGLIYLYNGYRVRQSKLEYDVKLAHMNAEKEKELNERKMAFFTDVSHEFRTPLTLIINPLKDVLSSGKPAEPAELNIVYRNAGRLLNLVDQLLQFQKAADNNDQLQIGRLNMYRLSRDVFESFLPQAKSKQIDYRFVCSNETLELYADRGKLEIVLFNLLSNAMKFTQVGGQVVFSLEERPEEVEITIADNGAGIPEGVGDKLFERFYQVAEHRHASKSGFGIGLYLAKHFVEKHKGSIWYQSEPAKGTAFYITLRKGRAHVAGQSILPEEGTPQMPVREAVGEQELTPVALPGKANGQKTGKLEPEELVSEKASLLVVEDNEEVRQYIKNIFHENFYVYEAEGGEAGMKLAQQYVPDIIISDVMMPNGTGIELCNRVKQDAALGHIPVILLTAHTASEKKLEGLECGADDYITKPFEKELLVARVANLLKNRTSIQKYFYSEITLQQHTLKLPAEYKAFLEKCIVIVEAHLQNDQFNIQHLARDIGMSHSNLYKKVKSVSGLSVNAFIRFIRLRKAAELLINTSMNVNETAFEVGMHDIKYFREQFHKLFGMNPSAYIKKYRKVLGASYRVNKESFGEGRGG